jgi:hypothetical protein
LFVNLKDGDIVKGIDIAKYGLRSILVFVKSGYITLNQISPKPNKKYQIYLTFEGGRQQDKLKSFITDVYPDYKKDVYDFHKTLKKVNLK